MTETVRTANDMIAEEIRVLKARTRIKDGELAKVLGISRQSFSSRMNGRLPFKTDELDLIATAFGVSVTALFPTRKIRTNHTLSLANSGGKKVSL